MSRPESLDDIWFTRDLLVLREVACRVEAGDEPLNVNDVAEAVGMDAQTVGKAGARLQDDGYVIGSDVGYGYGVVSFTDVTAKGRREVGQWPSPDAVADRLLAALDKAIEEAPEGEKRSKLKRAREALGAMGRDLLVDIAGGVIRGDIGP